MIDLSKLCDNDVENMTEWMGDACESLDVLRRWVGGPEIDNAIAAVNVVSDALEAELDKRDTVWHEQERSNQ